MEEQEVKCLEAIRELVGAHLERLAEHPTQAHSFPHIPYGTEVPHYLPTVQNSERLVGLVGSWTEDKT